MRHSNQGGRFTSPLHTAIIRRLRARLEENSLLLGCLGVSGWLVGVITLAVALMPPTSAPAQEEVDVAGRSQVDRVAEAVYSYHTDNDGALPARLSDTSLPADLLIDHNGVPLSYKRLTRWRFEVRGAGTDQVMGTGDDAVHDSRRRRSGWAGLATHDGNVLP